MESWAIGTQSRCRLYGYLGSEIRAVETLGISADGGKFISLAARMRWGPSILPGYLASCGVPLERGTIASIVIHSGATAEVGPTKTLECRGTVR